MGLLAPKLDDRSFQDLVDEAKKRIPHYCQEWTDHNLSDPGITLIELFAWMTDILLYRLNQVPNLHYIKFLELLGISLREPFPAQAPVTFWFSSPQPNDLTIPAQTEVASTQTETEPSIIFSTDRALTVRPPRLNSVLSRVESGTPGKKAFRELNLRRLEAGFEGIDVFSTTPQVGDALYFGFEKDLSHHILGFEAIFDPAGGAGIDPAQPPYEWQASSGAQNGRWRPCEVEIDTTRGMNTDGRIWIHLPGMGKNTINEQEQYWVRVKVREISSAELEQGMRPYVKSPRICKLSTASWGGTVPATHAQQIRGEFMGRSDGSPGQKIYLQNTPVLKRLPGEVLTVQLEGQPAQTWTEVPDFAGSGSEDRHYTLDSASGEIRFGPAVRQPDGTVKLYGAVPPRGANLIFERYRYGGGQGGNLQAGVLNTLKTAIPYVARVLNREPAWGGLDAETLEDARLRAPALLRSRDRAVTEADFEFLARQALPSGIGRVKCLQPASEETERLIPGQVFLLVIPSQPQPQAFLKPEQLQLGTQDMQALQAYLDERRLLTVHLDIRPPAYHWAAVHVKLRAAPGVDHAKVEEEVLARLFRFINPLTGGLDGTGWPFGRSLFASDIYPCLQGIPGVLFVRSMELYAARPGGQAQGDPLDEIDIITYGVVASGLHRVDFV